MAAEYWYSYRMSNNTSNGTELALIPPPSHTTLPPPHTGTSSGTGIGSFTGMGTRPPTELAAAHQASYYIVPALIQYTRQPAIDTTDQQQGHAPDMVACHGVNTHIRPTPLGADPPSQLLQRGEHRGAVQVQVATPIYSHTFQSKPGHLSTWPWTTVSQPPVP